MTLSIFLLFFNSRNYSCKELSCIQFAGKSEFSIKEIYEKNNNVFRAFYSDKKRNLRVEVVSDINSYNAAEYINSRIARMNALFGNAFVPYPGDISNEIVCPKEFRPEFYKINKEGLEIQYFIANLNQELIYGSCSADQIVYNGIEAFVYCPKNRQVFQLEILESKEKFKKSENLRIIKSIICK